MKVARTVRTLHRSAHRAGKVRNDARPFPLSNLDFIRMIDKMKGSRGDRSSFYARSPRNPEPARSARCASRLASEFFSVRRKRERNALLPFMEHAVSNVPKVRMVFDVGAKLLGGVSNRAADAFEDFADAGRRACHARLAQPLQFLRTRPFGCTV